MKSILLLEDEPLIAMDLRYAVEDAGYDAVAAVDNEEALEAIEKHDVAGAILDVSLGGGETCEATAAKLNALAIPFLLHTGDLNRVGETLRAIDAPVVAKPCPSDDVVAKLVGMLSK